MFSLLSYLFVGVLVLFVAVLAVWHIYIRIRFWPAFSSAPGECVLVTGWIPFIGVGLEYGKNPPAYLAAAQKVYGDVFSLYIFGQRFIFLLHPVNHALVFKSTTKLFTTSPVVHSITKLVAGHTIPYEKEVEVNQLFWTHLQPSNLIEPIERMASSLADRIQQRKLIRNAESPNSESEWHNWGLYRLTKECMFSAACVALFGDGSSDEADLQWQLEQFDILDNTFVPIAAGLPSIIPQVARGHKAIDRLGKHFGRGRSNRIHMLEAREKLARAYTDELSNQRLSVAFLWAAQTNTIPASFWCWYRILTDAVAQSVVMKEWAAVMKTLGHPLEKNGRINIVVDILRQLPTLDSALYEAMRLCSSANCFRVAMKEMQLNVYERNDAGGLKTRPLNVGKSDWVLVVPQLTHFDSQIFPRPTEYIYDRFVVSSAPNSESDDASTVTDEKEVPPTTAQTSSCAISLATGSVAGGGASQYMKNGEAVRYPCTIFGGGMDICPGRHFSFNELRIFVLSMLYHVEVQFIEGQPEPKLDDARPSIGVVPPNTDPQIRVRARTHAY